VSIDSKGQITDRDRLDYAGGISYRIAPPKDESNGGYQPAEGENSFPPRPEPEVDVPVKRKDTGFRPGEWNQIEVCLDVNMIRSFLNGGMEIGGRIESPNESGYGPIALHIGGEGEVRFKDLMYKDISIRTTPEEKSSPIF